MNCVYCGKEMWPISEGVGRCHSECPVYRLERDLDTGELVIGWDTGDDWVNRLVAKDGWLWCTTKEGEFITALCVLCGRPLRRYEGDGGIKDLCHPCGLAIHRWPEATSHHGVAFIRSGPLQVVDGLLICGTKQHTMTFAVGGPAFDLIATLISMAKCVCRNENWLACAPKEEEVT